MMTTMQKLKYIMQEWYNKLPSSSREDIDVGFIKALIETCEECDVYDTWFCIPESDEFVIPMIKMLYPETETININGIHHICFNNRIMQGLREKIKELCEEDLRCLNMHMDAFNEIDARLKEKEASK